jgi:hypothetical protein
MQWARRHLLVAENEEIIGAFHQGVLSQTVYEKLLADIHARLLNLESAERGDLQKTASSTAAQGQND